MAIIVMYLQQKLSSHFVDRTVCIAISFQWVGSDQSFVSKLHTELADHPHYVKGEDRRRWESEFGIRHYAGGVMYAAHGFLEKNKDAQVDALFELMLKASNAFVKDLVRFRDLVEITLQRSNESNPVCRRTFL